MTNTIIIAEKPKQAEAIKAATGGILTVPAAGHLLGLKPKKRSWDPPYFDLEWTTPNKKTKEKLDKMIKNIKGADNIIIGTDFDPEGQLIAYNILKEAEVDVHDVLRMKFSSLEHDELRAAYENPIDFDVLLARSAQTRTYLDWYFGMNISKAVTIRMKRDLDVQRGYYLTPVGRVQTPVLNYLAIHETEILEFMSKDEWRIRVYGVVPGRTNVYEINNFYREDYDDIDTITQFDKGEILDITEFQNQRTYLPPNKDHVVKECLRKGINPDIVDRVMQALYLDGFISYPRTTSRNYTDHGIDTGKYISSLDIPDLDFEVDEKKIAKPNEEPPEGPHPAIYPIKHYHDRDIGRLVWDVIVKALVKCHLPPEDYISRTMRVDIGSHIITDYKPPEGVTKGMKLKLYYDVKKHKTSPPRRYQLNKVYDYMVNNALGTVDTRTQILTKILRTYVFQTDDGLFTSGKGVKITAMLKELCPDLISVDLTKKFEDHVEAIKKDEGKIEKVLDEARETVTNIVKEILKE